MTDQTAESRGPLAVLADGLRFPEGPMPLRGDVFFVEVEGGNLTRLNTDGTLSRIALGGGPNGLAPGPDGKIYVCNNGGLAWSVIDGILYPGHQAPDYRGGRIERVDPRNGFVETLYTVCDGQRLSAPNDLVFDRYGGFYFTDTGKTRPRDRDHGGVYYASTDGSMIVPVVYPMLTPNGIGLSPDGLTLYVTETETARLWAFDIVEPGVTKRMPTINGGRLVIALGGGSARHVMLDGLALDTAGNICLSTLLAGCITVVTPGGEVVSEVKVPDIFPTNIAFGGPDMRTAYITLAATGRLATLPWPDPGLRLAHADSLPW
jgi:gluconolactonase